MKHSFGTPPALLKAMKRIVLCIFLMAAGFGIHHFFGRSSSLDLASVDGRYITANPLTEFSDFDSFIVNWSKLNPADPHSPHQTHWLEIAESAHCNRVPDQEVMLLEASHEFSWEPSQSLAIPSYSHSFQSEVSGRLINQAAFELSAEMQAHGCKAEDVQFEILLTPKFKTATSSDQDASDPERINITRSSNTSLETGNTHPLHNGIGSWTMSRGS